MRDADDGRLSDMRRNKRPTLRLVLTSFGAVRRINRAAQQLLGVDADDLIGQLWWSLCESEHNHDRILALLALLNQGDVEGYELPLVSPSGQVRRIRWDFIRTVDHAGSIDEILCRGVELP